MIRDFRPGVGGTGVIVFRPELDEEIAELEAVFPKDGLPPGVVREVAWNEAGHLTLSTRIDPTYKPPAVAPPTPTPPTYEAVPARERLAEWAMADMITKAAELGLVAGEDYKAGITKAALAGKIIDAWNKRNEELNKAALAGK